MTQDERWVVRYEEVMGFLEENHRNPSKHRIEEQAMALVCEFWQMENGQIP